MTSIFEAMGGYEGAPAGEAQPAKTPKRRVGEYTMRLSAQQWCILGALADGATLDTETSTFIRLKWSDSRSEWHNAKTATSLVRRELIRWAPNLSSYELTDAGRHVLRTREENRPGSGLI